jgi:hypothetical protein
MAWKNKNDPSIVNDPTYLEPRVSAVETKANNNATSLTTKAKQSDVDTLTTQMADITHLVPHPNGVDDTDAIQNVLNTYSNVLIPDGTYIIDPVVSLMIPSNRKITWAKNAVFQAKTNGADSYNVLTIKDVANVELINPNIIGDRDTHTATTGEWGHGIFMQGASNILIQNPTISKCWGDGIYIGSSTAQNHCYNVKITNPTIDLCRRQGISVISVKILRIEKGIISNINGTAPMDGIDFEPNFNTEFLEDILVDGLKTKACSGAGIEVYGNTYSNSTNKVSITIRNHTDNGSSYGFRPRAYMSNVEGFINVEKPIYRNNTLVPFLAEMWAYNAPRVVLNDPYVENAPNQFGALWIGATNSTTTDLNQDVGNIHIFNPKVVGNASSRCVYVGVPQKFRNLVNCTLKDPIQLDNSSTDNFLSMNNYFGMTVSNFVVEDRKEMLTNGSFSEMVRSGIIEGAKQGNRF